MGEDSEMQEKAVQRVNHLWGLLSILDQVRPEMQEEAVQCADHLWGLLSNLDKICPCDDTDELCSAHFRCTETCRTKSLPRIAPFPCTLFICTGTFEIQ